MRRHGAFIGFSPDGTYFAFEQYGTLDAGASNSGWSEIDIIDTRTDEFVGGKPIRIVDETDAHSRSGEGTGCRAGGADPRPICQRRAASGRPLTRFTFPDDMVAYQDIARLDQVSQKWLSPTYDELGISIIQLHQILADSTTDCSSSFDEQQGRHGRQGVRFPPDAAGTGWQAVPTAA
ncbi:hypothetical protein [Mesorhizobium sp.]|uniref:hypothetical protein n=1 Tax=Mesorhizobium sp. TaxID=1871066 RepID=UPI0025808E7C|nr:hypothetical protein [Mesorhizobium sp.]